MKALRPRFWLCAILLLAGAFLVVGRVMRSDPAVAIAEFNTRMAEHGLISFRSHEGKYVGNDDDTEITFLPDKTAIVWHYADTIDQHRGNYTLDPNGDIMIASRRPGRPYLMLRLGRDRTSLVLRWTGGAVISNDSDYWPFRPVTEREDFATGVRLNQ